MSDRQTLQARLVTEIGRERAADVLALLSSEDSETPADTHWLKPVLDAAGHTPILDVPDALSKRLDAMLPARSHQLLIAELQLDSRVDRQLAGVRGASSGGNWTMMFRTEPADIALGVRPQSPTGSAPTTLRLAGQVLARNGQQRQFTAHLSPTSGTPDTASTDTGDRFGRFMFADVTPAQHTLLISDDTNEILVELDLRSPQ